MEENAQHACIFSMGAVVAVGFHLAFMPSLVTLRLPLYSVALISILTRRRVAQTRKNRACPLPKKKKSC